MSLTTTRFYRSTDPGAPALNGTANSLIDLLIACLVGDGTGVAYGTGGDSKLAAGWTLEYQDAGNAMAIFRNSQAAGGTGCCVQVINTDRTPSINAGRDWASNALIDPTGSRSFDVSDTADNSAREWAIFADERTFYVACKPSLSSLQYGGLRGAGDWESYWAGDACAYGIMVSPGGTTFSYAQRVSAGTSGMSMGPYGAPVLVAGRNSDFSPTGAHFFAVTGVATPGVTLGGGLNLDNSFEETNPPNGVIITQPAYIRVGLNNEVTGRMRLLHVCDNVILTGGLVELRQEMKSATGKVLAQVRSHSFVNGNMYTPMFVEIE